MYILNKYNTANNNNVNKINDKNLSFHLLYP